MSDGKQFIRVVGIDMVQFASPIIMNHNDELVAALGLDLKFAADAWEIRFTDGGYTKQPPSNEVDHRRTT